VGFFNNVTPGTARVCCAGKFQYFSWSFIWTFTYYFEKKQFSSVNKHLCREYHDGSVFNKSVWMSLCKCDCYNCVGWPVWENLASTYWVTCLLQQPVELKIV
jgi:hypothetical protein